MMGMILNELGELLLFHGTNLDDAGVLVIETWQ